MRLAVYSKKTSITGFDLSGFKLYTKFDFIKSNSENT